MARFSLEDISLDDYIQAKRDSVINAALEKSRTRTEPEYIYIKNNLSDEEKQHYKNAIKDVENQIESLNYSRYGNPFINYHTKKYTKDREKELANSMRNYNYPLIESALAGVPFKPTTDPDKNYNLEKQQLEKTVNDYKEYLKDCIPGFNCINTVTNNYGRGHQVAGNQLFYANPSKYGFIEIAKDDIKPGDLIQIKDENKVPYHAIMFNGYDEKGEPTYNYSTGTDIYRKNVHWRGVLNKTGNDNRVYRFVGNSRDIEDWTNEYNNRKHRNGGRISLTSVR